jgi:pimeloyl-ACP methyl ester carboxylesterase
MHGFGYDEWRDLDAAVRFAQTRGAADVVLVGFGSGASVVGAYLAEAREPERVAATVLDGPLLDLNGLIEESWVDKGVPVWAMGWTKAIAAARFGIDFGALDHLERIESWAPPTLILHGRDDARYPLEVSEVFAITKGDQALLLTFPGAGTGQSWNVDPERYESAVLGFLDEEVRGPSRLEVADR